MTEKKLERMKVEIMLQEEMLGTTPSDPKLWEEYIASRAPDAPSIEQEIKTNGVDRVVEKAKTIFPKNDQGKPIIWAYQIKGFFKDACGMLWRAKGTLSSGLTAYKKTIDGLIFVMPNDIVVDIDPKEIGECQRPLRANTPQGDIVALSYSESIPPGTLITFEIAFYKTKKVDLKPIIVEWLEYGELRGLGQWRNSGKGRFVYEIIK